MKRYSYPSIPADRAHQSRGSRPLSLVLGPFPQPHEDGAGDISMGRVPNARGRGKVEDDERPLTELELEAPSESAKGDAEKEYPASWKLAIITIALCMAIFLVALVSLHLFFTSHPTQCKQGIQSRLIHDKDTTIVAAAIPRITDHFKALDDGMCALSSVHAFTIDRSRSGMVWKCLPTHHL